MTFVLGLCYFLLRTVRKSKSVIVRARYGGSATIAEYFRKQGAQIGEVCGFSETKSPIFVSMAQLS